MNTEVKVEYDDNGTKISEKHFKDGKEDGVSNWWYEDGNKRYEKHYKNGELIKKVA